MKVLIVADIQNDFLRGGSLAVPDSDAIIPVVNRLIHYFGLVIAIQDWHPADHKSFASMHPGKKPLDIIDLHGLQQTLWPDHCIQGTKGAAFSALLEMNKAEVIFRKGTDPEIDSYSGFYDNGHRKSTGLAGYLHEKKVSEVYVTGLAGDYCVYLTAMDSLEEKFSTFIIEDATRPINPENFKKVMQQFVAKGGKIIRSTDV
jgi:nicotinamidase/pyrazinamidase